MTLRASVTKLYRPLIWLALALGFVFPIFASWGAMGGWDQTYFHAFDETARRTILDFGQFPAWNPYHCGGRTLVGHVANVHLHPLFFLLVLPLGTAVAYKFYLLLHIFLAIAGTDCYLRERGAEDLGALLGGVAFGACGYFSWHFAGGHVSYYGLTLTPWLLICLDRARTHVRYGIWAGLVLASTFLMAGAYSYPFQVLLVAVHTIVYSVRDRSWKPLITACIAAAVSLGVSGIKVGPVLDFTLRHSRPSPLLEKIMPWEIFRMLLSREHGYGRWPGHPFTWPEYGSYIGYLPLGFALAGLFRQTRERAFAVAMVCLFGLLVLGGHGDWSPYALLRKLPVYKDLRVPSRYMIFVVFFLAVLAGFAMSAWRRAIERVPDAPLWRRYLPHIVLLVAIYEVLSFGHVELKRTYNIKKPVPVKPHKEFFQSWVGRPQVESYLGPYRNVGITNCYEEGANPRSRYLRRGRVPQVYLADRRDGSISAIHVTPNIVTFHAKLSRETLVVLNQNFDTGWRTPQRKAEDYRGLIAFRLPAGEHDVVARFRPTSLVLGAIVSIVAILGIIAAFVIIRRRERKGWGELFFPQSGPQTRTETGPQASAPADASA